MNNITQNALALSQNNNRKMALTRQQQIVESKMRYHVRDWHARIQRVQENPHLQQQIPHQSFQNLDSIYNTLIPVPRFELQRHSTNRYADPVLRGVDTAIGFLGTTGDIRDDLRNFILNSGRVKDLAKAAMDPRLAVQVNFGGSGNYNFEDPSFAYENFPFFKEGTPRLGYTEVVGADGNKTWAFENGTVGGGAQRFQSNLYLENLMHMANTGDVLPELKGKDLGHHVPSSPDVDRSEWAIQQLMQNDDVLQAFVKLTGENGHRWEHIAGAEPGTHAYESQAVDQLKAFVSNDVAGTAVSEAELGKWQLTRDIPVYANTAFGHYFTLAKAKGGYPDDKDVQLIQGASINGAEGKALWETDSSVDFQTLSDAETDLEALKNQILEEQSDLDQETTQLTTEKEYWQKQLAAAQAEIPRMISRPWGSGGGGQYG